MTSRICRSKTQDRVKYVCEHSVIGRVKLKRVLNPADWFSRSTYLRAETDPVEDTDTDVNSSLLEQEVRGCSTVFCPFSVA